MRIQRALLTLAAGLLFGSAIAQISPVGKGYLLRAKYVKGAVRHYTMTIITSAATIKVVYPFSLKVVSVKKGVGKLRFVAGPMKVGKQPLGQSQVIEASLNGRGVVVNGEGAVQQFGQMSFPEKPVRVGGVWKTTVDTMAGQMPMHVDGVFKLVGFKTLAKKHVAMISTTVKNSKSFPTSGHGTISLDVSDASLLRSEMNLVISIRAPKGQPQAGKTSRYRVKVLIERL